MKNIVKNIDNVFNLSQSNVNVVAWFSFDGSTKEYELNLFRINFYQPVDHKGQPQTETIGGQIILNLSESVGDDIYGWAIRPTVKKNGQIVFKTEGASAPMRISFNNAYCISLKRIVDSIGGGLYTALILSPESVFINGIEFDNFW